MGKTKFETLVCTIKVEQLKDVLSGSSKEHQYEWLNTSWMQVRGLKPVTGVQFCGINPLISGTLEGFEIPETFRGIVKSTLIFLFAFDFN